VFHASYSAEEKVVPASGKALIGTGLSLAVPIGTYGRVAPRSGLGEFRFLDDDARLTPHGIASKFMIATGAGVVDADYRGQLYVLLFNHSDDDFKSAYPCLFPTIHSWPLQSQLVTVLHSSSWRRS
jgi:dUTP pyrophosphatase